MVAGGRGEGNSLTQLFYPSGICVDRLGSVYVMDQGNGRVVRWLNGAENQRARNNQLNGCESLSLDHRGNLYVLDRLNHRVQRFDRHRTVEISPSQPKETEQSQEQKDQPAAFLNSSLIVPSGDNH